MEHPPKQGLKLPVVFYGVVNGFGFNGTSTKTRIETYCTSLPSIVLPSFNGTSTKTRIETFQVCDAREVIHFGFNGTSTKTRIETT